MIDLNVLENEVRDWSVKNWPAGGDPHKNMTKLVEELGELGRAMIRGESIDIINAEGADVLITLEHLLICLGGSLYEGVDYKWPIVRDRDPHSRHTPEHG